MKTNSEIKTSDFIANFLYKNNITHVFEVIGGMTTHLTDSIYCQKKINLVSMHHEQAAAFAAEGFARMTGVPGVAMATSGPGATNLLTGIGSCYFDSVPAVFITGQVNRKELKGKQSVRQLGFQETDIVSMAKPIAKNVWRAYEPNKIASVFEKAFKCSLSNRPGPVLIDIPMDVQRSLVESENPENKRNNKKSEINNSIIVKLLNDLRNAKKPLILIGGGIRAGRASEKFIKLAELLDIPVVHSLMAVDVLPYSHPLRVGMIGTYGNRWSNWSIGQSDFLLVLGSRLDVRQTGADTQAFKKNRVVYHVDCDEAEVNNRITNCFDIIADLNVFIESFINIVKKIKFKDNSKWHNDINNNKNMWADTNELSDIKGINPNKFIHQLAKVSDNAAAYTIDIGQHQMWAAQSIELNSKQRFLTSGGMGSLGFAVPAAIGACVASGNKPIVAISGDGGMQFNIQELETIAYNKLPVKLVVINNNSYGMVRQFQQSYFEERYQSTCWGYSAPDFCRVAEAYGIPSININSSNDIDKGLAQLWKEPNKPYLMQVKIDAGTNVYPKIAFGHPMTEMEPFTNND